jgi:hypothetical protein
LDQRARADSIGSANAVAMGQGQAPTLDVVSREREDLGGSRVGVGGSSPTAASAADGLSSASAATAATAAERLPSSPARCGSGPPSSSPAGRMRRGNSAPPGAYASPIRTPGGSFSSSFGTASALHLNGSPSSDSLRSARRPLRLGAIFKPLRNGVDVIVDDSFWRCFEDREAVPWNWNFYLFPIWLVGTLLRFLVLFPIRLVLLILGFTLCALGFLFVRLWYAIGCSCRSCGHANRLSAESSCVRIFASSFVVSWSGVVRYHGIRPSDTMQKRVFVANHSSMIDVAIVLQRDNYSLVGQQHKGWIAFIQNTILASLHCVWFQRGEARDRNAVFRKLQKHARNEQGNLPVRRPLGVFELLNCLLWRGGVFVYAGVGVWVFLSSYFLSFLFLTATHTHALFFPRFISLSLSFSLSLSLSLSLLSLCSLNSPCSSFPRAHASTQTISFSSKRGCLC